LIVVLWRAALRTSEARALADSDLDSGGGAVRVRHGKAGKRREVAWTGWAWEQLDLWLALRATFPVGALFCVLRGPTGGRPWSAAGVRVQFHDPLDAAECDDALHPTSFGMPTPSRCRAKACRCW
jgi:integrase